MEKVLGENSYKHTCEHVKKESQGLLGDTRVLVLILCLSSLILL